LIIKMWNENMDDMQKQADKNKDEKKEENRRLT